MKRGMADIVYVGLTAEERIGRFLGGRFHDVVFRGRMIFGVPAHRKVSVRSQLRRCFIRKPELVCW